MGDLPGTDSRKAHAKSRKRFWMIGGGVLAAALLTAGIWSTTVRQASMETVNADGTTSSSTGGYAPNDPEQSGRPPSGSKPAPTVPPVSIPTQVPLSTEQAQAKEQADKALADTPQSVAPAVELGVASKPQGGVTATVSSIEAVDGKAQGPGEISGPAVRFTVTLNNGGTNALDGNAVVVNVDSGPDHIPALVLSGPGAVNFPSSIEPGNKASGTYVFLIPNNQRDDVRIFFNYKVSSPIAAFEGAVPKAQG